MENTTSWSVLTNSASEALPDCLRRALFYAKLSWRVLPLHAVLVGGFVAVKILSAAVLASIQDWWRCSPHANMGIATGNGLLVVDIDPRHGSCTLPPLLTRSHGPSSLQARGFQRNSLSCCTHLRRYHSGNRTSSTHYSL